MRPNDLHEYLFNDTYYPDLIQKEIYRVNNNLYLRCLKAQKDYCNLIVIEGKMSEFTQNPILNERFNLKYDCFSAPILHHDIHYFVKQKAFYAGKETYSELEVCKNNDTFESRYMFFVDGYYLANVSIIPDINQSYLFIDIDPIEDVETGLKWSAIHDFVKRDVPYTLLLSPPCNYMTTDKSPINLFDKDGINIKKMNRDGFNKKSKVNSYMFTYSASEMDKNLMAITFCDMQVVNKESYAMVSKPFMDYVSGIRKNGFGRLYNNINLKGILDLKQVRAFQIPIYNMPVCPENILFFIYDKDTDTYRFCHQIKCSIHFPNVYTIDEIPEEYAESHLRALFFYADLPDLKWYNPIADYMEFNTKYMEDLLKEDLPSGIMKYIPLDFSYYDIPDFQRSPVYANSDMYKLEGLVNLMFDDPSRYNQLYDHIVKATYKFDFRYRFNMKEKPYFLERKRKNNHREITKSFKQQTFNGEYTFIMVNHPDDRLYSLAVWIDGMRYQVKYRYMEYLIEYIYLPLDRIKSDSTIELEFFKIPENNRKYGEIIFPSVGEMIEFPKEFDLIAEQHIMFYEKDSKIIIDRDGIKYSIGEDCDPQFVLTNKDEFVQTKFDEYVILGDFYLEAEDDDGFYRYVPTDTFKISTTLQRHVNVPIIVQNCDDYQSLYYKNLKDPYKIIVENFTNDPTPNRFRIYNNGVLLEKDKDYTYRVPTHWNSTLEFTLLHPDPYKNEVIWEYLPYRYIKIGAVYNLYSQIVDIGRHITRPFDFDQFDLYLNGKLTTEKDLTRLTNTKIYFNEPLDDAYISIYEKAHDSEIYGNPYKKNSINDTLVGEVDGFADFLHKKYHGDAPDQLK